MTTKHMRRFWPHLANCWQYSWGSPGRSLIEHFQIWLPDMYTNTVYCRGSIPWGERKAHTHSCIATSAKCTGNHYFFFLYTIIVYNMAKLTLQKIRMRRLTWVDASGPSWTQPLQPRPQALSPWIEKSQQNNPIILLEHLFDRLSAASIVIEPSPCKAFVPLWKLLCRAFHQKSHDGVDRVFSEEGQSRKVQNLKRRSSAASLLIGRVFLFPFNFPHIWIFISGHIQITLSHFDHFPTSILKCGWSLDIPSHPMKAKYQQVYKDPIVLIMWQQPYWSPIAWVLAQRKNLHLGIMSLGCLETGFTPSKDITARTWGDVSSTSILPYLLVLY